jgi:hypothetical protein
VPCRRNPTRAKRANRYISRRVESAKENAASGMSERLNRESSTSVDSKLRAASALDGRRKGVKSSNFRDAPVNDAALTRSSSAKRPRDVARTLPSSSCRTIARLSVLGAIDRLASREVEVVRRRHLTDTFADRAPAFVVRFRRSPDSPLIWCAVTDSCGRVRRARNASVRAAPCTAIVAPVTCFRVSSGDAARSRRRRKMADPDRVRFRLPSACELVKLDRERVMRIRRPTINAVGAVRGSSVDRNFSGTETRFIGDRRKLLEALMGKVRRKVMREWSCSEKGCNEHFKVKDKLREHMALVHPSVVFSCPECRFKTQVEHFLRR